MGRANSRDAVDSVRFKCDWDLLLAEKQVTPAKQELFQKFVVEYNRAVEGQVVSDLGEVVDSALQLSSLGKWVRKLEAGKEESEVFLQHLINLCCKIPALSLGLVHGGVHTSVAILHGKATKTQDVYDNSMGLLFCLLDNISNRFNNVDVYDDTLVDMTFTTYDYLNHFFAKSAAGKLKSNMPRNTLDALGQVIRFHTPMSNYVRDMLWDKGAHLTVMKFLLLDHEVFGEEGDNYLQVVSSGVLFICRLLVDMARQEELLRDDAIVSGFKSLMAHLVGLIREPNVPDKIKLVAATTLRNIFRIFVVAANAGPEVLLKMVELSYMEVLMPLQEDLYAGPYADFFKEVSALLLEGMEELANNHTVMPARSSTKKRSWFSFLSGKPPSHCQSVYLTAEVDEQTQYYLNDLSEALVASMELSFPQDQNQARASDGGAHSHQDGSCCKPGSSHGEDGRNSDSRDQAHAKSSSSRGVQPSNGRLPVSQQPSRSTSPPAACQDQGASNSSDLGGKGGVPACALCGKAEDGLVKLKKCTKCKEAQYCSKDCQRQDWPSHKKTCGKSP